MFTRCERIYFLSEESCFSAFRIHANKTTYHPKEHFFRKCSSTSIPGRTFYGELKLATGYAERFGLGSQNVEDLGLGCNMLCDLSFGS